MLTVLKFIWRKWKRFGEFMAEVVSFVLFFVLYILLFAPLALFFKIVGRKFLPQYTGREESYYLEKEQLPPTLEFMRRQG
jgi:hypothetical protein